MPSLFVKPDSAKLKITPTEKIYQGDRDEDPLSITPAAWANTTHLCMHSLVQAQIAYFLLVFGRFACGLDIAIWGDAISLLILCRFKFEFNELPRALFPRQ